MNIVKFLLIILFLVCLFDMPYGYYELVRFIGMVGFTFLGYDQFEKNKVWFFIWLVSAVLINPFFKIALGREIWNIVDVIWAVLLVSSNFFKKGIERKEVTQ